MHLFSFDLRSNFGTLVSRTKVQQRVPQNKEDVHFAGRESPCRPILNYFSSSIKYYKAKIKQGI